MRKHGPLKRGKRKATSKEGESRLPPPFPPFPPFEPPGARAYLHEAGNTSAALARRWPRIIQRYPHPRHSIKGSDQGGQTCDRFGFEAD